MKDEIQIKNKLDGYIQSLIDSRIIRILGVTGIENENELKGFIKALQWVRSNE